MAAPGQVSASLGLEIRIGHTEPEEGDGRLGGLLGALLELVLRLAHLVLLVFGELGVAPALLEGLGL